MDVNEILRFMIERHIINRLINMLHSSVSRSHAFCMHQSDSFECKSEVSFYLWDHWLSLSLSPKSCLVMPCEFIFYWCASTVYMFEKLDDSFVLFVQTIEWSAKFLKCSCHRFHPSNKTFRCSLHQSTNQNHIQSFRMNLSVDNFQIYTWTMT